MPINQVLQDTSVRVTGVIVDYDGVGFQPTELRFTLYDRATGQIINSRNNINLTPIGTYVSAGGVLVHTLARTDQVLASASAGSEIHVLRYKWIYTAGADAGIAEIEYQVCRDPTPTS